MNWIHWTLIIILADAVLFGVFVAFFRGANDVPDRAKRARTLSWKDEEQLEEV